MSESQLTFREVIDTIKRLLEQDDFLAWWSLADMHGIVSWFFAGKILEEYQICTQFVPEWNGQPAFWSCTWIDFSSEVPDHEGGTMHPYLFTSDELLLVSILRMFVEIQKFKGIDLGVDLH